MPFGDGQKFGKIQVHKIDDNFEPDNDKALEPSPAQQALLPKAREVRVSRPRFDLIYARLDETPVGKESDDSTPERVCWIYQNKLVSTQQLFKSPADTFDVEPTQGKGLFMTRKALIEADLNTGATVEFPFKNWPDRNPPGGAAYLLDGQILMYSATVALGTRATDSIELQRALELEALGVSVMKQRVLFFCDQPTRVIGYDRGTFRELANLGVRAKSPWLISSDRFRFYVDSFQNKKLPPESCGTFEVSGVLEAWEDCFAKHSDGYPELAQTSLAELGVAGVGQCGHPDFAR